MTALTSEHTTIAPRQARRAYIAARPVASFVPRLTRKAFEKHGFSSAALIADWPQIAGRDLTEYTQPERLKWPRGTNVSGEPEPEAKGRPGATLVLRVEPSRALDVEYGSRQIIERINTYFGYRAIAALTILQVPLPAVGPATRVTRPLPDPPPGADLVSLTCVEDDRLRTALAQMQKGVQSRRASLGAAATDAS